MVAKQRRSIPKEQRTFSQPKECRQNARRWEWSPQPSLQQRNQPRLKMEKTMSSTPIDYRMQVAAQVEQNAAEQKAAANEAAWQEIINRYVIQDHDANRRMVEDFCNGTIELAKFKFLVDNPPAGFQLDWSTEDALKTELIEKILAARTWSPVEAELKRKAMRFQALRMLR